MPKLFCVSDIHGFYDEFKSALDAAGFDQDNPEHWLISCGDHFDRGSKPKEVLCFLNSLERKVLIRGNHEDLLEQLIDRCYPMDYDKRNRTSDTVFDLSTLPHQPRYFREACAEIEPMVLRFTSQTVDSFETQNYVFVHGWLPVRDGVVAYPHAFAYEWDQARWRNGIDCALHGLTIDKTVVCGHWHCSYGHAKMEDKPEFGYGADFSPFYANGIIAIDGCTAASGVVNVVVIEDEFLPKPSNPKNDVIY